MRFTPVPGCGREEESSRDRRGIRKNGNPHKSVETTSLRDTGSGHRDTREPTTPRTGGASASTEDKHCQDSGGKKHKSQPWEVTWREFLNVTSEDLWRLQKILHSNKGSLSKTNKTNTEANAKVYDLNQKTMKAVDTLAFLHSTFERAGKNLGEVDDSEGQRRPEIRGNHPGTGLQSAR